MSITEVTTRLSELARAIAEQSPSIAQIVATKARSVLHDRIVQHGLDANEVMLNAYSPSYKKVRERKDLQTNHVDLTVHAADNGMWFGTKIISAAQNGNRYEVIIGGDDQATKNKIEWNSERYGDILRVSLAEEEQLQLTIDDEIEKLIAESGLK